MVLSVREGGSLRWVRWIDDDGILGFLINDEIGVVVTTADP